jgi:CO/xanthine dehydrogenase Mo-binding subunit
MTVVREPPTRTQVGVSRPRRDAREKLRGEAQFVGDMLVPRMLYGRVLRSPIAHGRIAAIDVSAAEKIPGVVCVLTGADLHDIEPYYGHAIKDRPIIAIDKVRFHGEQVAAVAAETPAAAAAAVEAIVVDYEELPVVADVEAAVVPGSPLVTDRELVPGLFHGLGELAPRDGNVCYRYRLDKGEPEAVFAHADVVVEGEYAFPAVYQ